MKNQTPTYCAAHGGRLKATNRRRSPLGRNLTVCESCRRAQAKTQKAAATA